MLSGEDLGIGYKPLRRVTDTDTNGRCMRCLLNMLEVGRRSPESLICSWERINYDSCVPHQAHQHSCVKAKAVLGTSDSENIPLTLPWGKEEEVSSTLKTSGAVNSLTFSLSIPKCFLFIMVLSMGIYQSRKPFKYLVIHLELTKRNTLHVNINEILKNKK